jgi:hypothetical protein
MHGEEDRNLRRGKELFLSQARVARLKELWTTGDFERNLNTARGWVPIENLETYIKECHKFT